MFDVLRLALSFAFYWFLAFAFLLSVFVLPGWVWWTAAAIIGVLLILEIARGAGSRLAAKIIRVLFWPNGG